MSHSPIVLPEDFADLQRAIRLSNRAATYLMKHFSGAPAALDFGRMLCASVRPPEKLNNTYEEFLQQLSRSNLAFIDFKCCKAARTLAASLEQYAQLPIKLPYSSIINEVHIDNDAFASLHRLEYPQIRQINKIVRRCTKNASIYKVFAYYNGLLPEAEDCLKSPTKISRRLHYSSTEIVDIQNRVYEKLKQPEIAAQIVMLAFSKEEGEYMLSQLPESHPFAETLKQRIQELHDHVGYDTTLDAADFASQLHNTLAYYPITHIEQLASLSYEQLFRIRGLSTTDCRTIMAYLKTHKMYFLDEKFYY